MPDHPRIDELQRRVERDPASIAFAQLAEEHRRAGQFTDAVRVCRTGLSRHPEYLSARVTLARALVELDALDEARDEFDRVIKAAPENLTAVRGVADIHHKRGQLAEALGHYKLALSLTNHDADLQKIVADLTARVEASGRVDETRRAARAHAERSIQSLQAWLDVIVSRRSR